MPTDIVRELWNEIDEEQKSELIINGLIYDFRGKCHEENEKLRLLSAAGFVATDTELIKTLTGYCAAEKFYFNKETLGLIGTVSELKRSVDHRHTPFARKIDQSCTILGSVRWLNRLCFRGAVPHNC